MLRHVGCSLPIQLWHLGKHEVDGRMRCLLAPFAVECVDAEASAEWSAPRKLVQPKWESLGRLSHGGIHEKAKDRRRSGAIAT